MKLVRTIFVALAVMLPLSWTVAKAAETTPTPAPAAGETTKKEKKSKTSDTAPSGAEKTDKKADKK